MTRLKNDGGLFRYLPGVVLKWRSLLKCRHNLHQKLTSQYKARSLYNQKLTRNRQRRKSPSNILTVPWACVIDSKQSWLAWWASWRLQMRSWDCSALQRGECFSTTASTETFGRKPAAGCPLVPECLPERYTAYHLTFTLFFPAVSCDDKQAVFCSCCCYYYFRYICVLLEMNAYRLRLPGNFLWILGINHQVGFPAFQKRISTSSVTFLHLKGSIQVTQSLFSDVNAPIYKNFYIKNLSTATTTSRGS